MSNFIKNGAIATDTWQTVRLPVVEEAVRKQAGKVVLFKLTGAESATPEQIAQTELPAGRIIVPLPVWRARQDELASRVAAGEIGVWIDTHELLDTLVDTLPDLNVLPVIGVHVERFADGRNFSIATLLRTRHGYKNELRVFGDVLRDQMFFYKRCGFDAYLVRADRSAEEALRGLTDFTDPYQGAVDDPQPLWRRHARA
ncbi:MAG: DUF934 domain-containing protein [Rhodocyclaceae bacterium]